MNKVERIKFETSNCLRITGAESKVQNDLSKFQHKP